MTSSFVRKSRKLPLVSHERNRGRAFGCGTIAALSLLHGQHLIAEPTFANDIAPIIYEHCATCHNPNGIGPFSFLSYQDAKRRAPQIAEVVETGYMPPWKPAKGHGPKLIGERGLSQKQIETIISWADGNRLSGNLDTAPSPPEFESNWTLGEPDLVLSLPEDFILRADGDDVFRNFVIRPPITETTYVRAVEFIPNTKLAIHHATISADNTPYSRARDAAEPGPGYGSMDIGNATRPGGHIIGWTPGQRPFETYPGTSWKIEPGTDVIVQLHMLPTGKEEQINPQVGLFFTNEPPTLNTYVLLLREFEIDVPPGETNHWVEERLKIPADTEILGLYPHAHYIGKEFKVYAELPNGETQWLIEIPDWDFNWQSDYRFEKPLFLPAGSELVMQLSYDNSAANIRNPFSPPQRIQAGWNSTDEMGEVAIKLLLKDEKDLLAFKETQARYDLTSSGPLPSVYYNLAHSLDQQNRWNEAKTNYEKALELDPRFAKAWNNLAAIEEHIGNSSNAIAFYRKALEVDTNAYEANMNVARLLADTNQYGEAIEIYRKLLQKEPMLLQPRVLLATQLFNANQGEQAIETLETGRKWHQNKPSFLLTLGSSHLASGHQDKAEQDLKQALVAIENSTLATNQKNHFQAEAHYYLSLTYEAANNYLKFTDSVNNLLAANPSHPHGLLFAATLAITDQDRDTAIKYFKQLIALPDNERPSEKTLLNHLPFPEGIAIFAQAKFEAGERNEAIEFLDRVATLLTNAGNPDGAKQMSVFKNWLQRQN